MKKYRPYIVYFGYWVFYFIISKVLFLVYHHALSGTLTAAEILKVFLYGFRMDVSFTSYICIFPFILFFIRTAFVKINTEKLIKIYTIIVIVLISFVTTADLQLYTAWGYRMDATPLQYFKSPKEMGASVSSSPLLLLLTIFIILTFFFIWIYNRLVEPYIHIKPGKFSLLNSSVALFLVAVLFVPIRGGIQKIPMNQSDVYFSEKLFADHAALNLPWNIFFSVLNQNNKENPFDYFSVKKSGEIVDALYNTGPVKIPSILSVKKPNIIFIIMESYTAKFVGCLGGEPGVTPNLDKIASDGLLFTNIYAAGDRSEKGQVAVLSGYPNQALTSIIKTPTKTQQLPSITTALEAEGYHTSYTYGGELEFANIKSYLVNTDFNRLISKYDFPVAERTTSWGVHDQYVFNRFFNDIKQEQQPFFATLFTLSSHEPYDVPMAPKFKGNDETTKFKNSVAYTDSCVGVFINRLKNDPLWQNTLVVFVADHGHPLPGYDRNDLPSKFHIPLIFTGGALKVKGVVSTIGSQTDIVKTVLDQLDIASNKFTWSKDLLDSSARPFAFYSFNDGFGFVTPSGIVTMDNISRKIIFEKGKIDSADVNNGKAYMQLSYQDFLNR
ncbi:MAG TPA: sulfatase-like hydrolase/transferase [Ginsengibacter sp.]|nr:sulfatase-like hydrolase/transferase [Ginsengibacter sp.]